MALKKKVKINRVNNLSDARYTAGMGVEWMGFVLDPKDPGRISAEYFEGITGWISGVKLVAEFNQCTFAQITALLPNYAVNCIQTDLDTELTAIKSLGLPVILRLTMCPEVEIKMKALKNLVDYFLLESEPGEIQSFTEAISLAPKYPIILGFGLEVARIPELIESHSLQGIAIAGGHEIKPGLKDFDHLAEILEALEMED